ncbi:MAG: amino acid adenylation domain-containing protein [Desulfobacterales bacterium]|nr:amino acid adenylation domain-containing protein [Desulfobacterales bacterium]
MTNIDQSLKITILESICKITGHKVEELNEDMLLEGDIGLDSINMVSLMNELTNLMPENKREEFVTKYPPGDLYQLELLGDLISIFESRYFYGIHSNDEKELIMINPQKEGIDNTISNKNIKEIEIVNSQYTILLSHWNLSSLTVGGKIKINGPLDLDVLLSSWNTIINRYPTFRGVFDIPENATSFDDYKFVEADMNNTPKIDIIDLNNMDLKAQNNIIENESNNMVNSQFQITKWPMQGITVFKRQSDEFEILFMTHHLISDGTGNQIFLKELLEIYSSKMSGGEPEILPPVSFDKYNSIVKQLNSWNDPSEKEKYEKYEKTNEREKKYFMNPAGKKADFSNELIDSIKTLHYKLGKDTTDKLIESTSRYRVSLFSLLVSAFLKAIGKIDKTDKIRLNLPTSGKVYPNVDASNIIGCFAQNLVLNFDLKNGENYEKLVKRVDKQIKSAIYSGYDRVQVHKNGIDLKKNLKLENGKLPNSFTPFVRAAILSNVYLSFIGNTNIKNEYDGLKITDYGAYSSTFSGASDNIIEIFDNNLTISANYDSGFFEKDIIDNLVLHFFENLRQIANSEVENRISNLLIENNNDQISNEVLKVTSEISKTALKLADMGKDLEAEFGIDSLEKVRIITKLGLTFKEIDREVLLDCRTMSEIAVVISGEYSKKHNSLTEEKDKIDLPYLKIIDQCKKTPDGVAILFDGEKVSYSKLHHISNKIANYLKTQGVGPNIPVGIMTEPGPNMLYAILGTLKAGGAYVPVDPNFPDDRIHYILNHSKIEIIITENEIGNLRTIFKNNKIHKKLIFLDEGNSGGILENITEIDQDKWLTFSDDEPVYCNSPEDLMNILYTSGSTGNPKGVMSNHAGYMNQLTWHQKEFEIKLEEKVVQKTTYCFDISIWELFWPLMYGATICPVRKETVKNPWKMAKWLNELKISIMLFVPSEFGEFMNAIEYDSIAFPHLRWIQFIGEALPISSVQKWIDKFGNKTGLVNLYGPTEASIAVTYHVIKKRPDSEGDHSIPIGKPMDNVDILILNKEMNLVKPEEIGELWIGGVQLAKGYFNNHEKTSEAFKPNSFKEIKGKYIYRTGDLAKKLPDGSIEYHGRIDNQIKIRGFRVELGEIEAVLSNIKSIKEAAVIVMESDSNQKRLIACLSGDEISSSEIKESISKKLTYYMIPHEFKWFDSLPKNSNGKLDRNAIKKMISGDNSEQIEGLKEDQKNIKELNEQYLPLGPAQKWLMTHFDPPYSWTGYTRFKYKKALDLKYFNKAVKNTIKRHDALRAVFIEKESEWVQKILPPEITEQKEIIQFYDGSHLSTESSEKEIHNLINNVIKGFEIEKYPLIQFIIIKFSDELYDISVIGHHIVADLVNSSILFEDIFSYYSQLSSGIETPELPQALSFKKYIDDIEKEKSGDELIEYINYWKSQFPSKDYSFSYSKDYNYGNNSEKSAKRIKLSLNKSDSEILLGKAKKFFNCNVYPVLLAPLYKLFSEINNDKWVVISHRSHGRDIDNNRTFFKTAGNFAVHYPVGINLSSGDIWKKIVGNIKNSLDAVPMNGVSFDMISEHLPSYMYPDEKLTPIRANYHGNRSQKMNSDIEFMNGERDVRFSSSDQKRMSIIEFFFFIEDGVLNMEIEYSKNYHSEMRIRRIGKRYMQLLDDIISTIRFQAVDQKNTLKPININSDNIDILNIENESQRKIFKIAGSLLYSIGSGSEDELITKPAKLKKEDMAQFISDISDLFNLLADSKPEEEQHYNKLLSQ